MLTNNVLKYCACNACQRYRTVIHCFSLIIGATLACVHSVGRTMIIFNSWVADDLYTLIYLDLGSGKSLQLIMTHL